MVTRPATAAKAMPASELESVDVDHLGLTLRLADLLRSRLPADMAGKLMALPETTLEKVLASRQDSLNTALVLQFANGSLPEAIHAFTLLCKSDCLAGRTQLVDSWLTCHTEIMVAQLHAKLRSSSNKRHTCFIDSFG